MNMTNALITTLKELVKAIGSHGESLALSKIPRQMAIAADEVAILREDMERLNNICLEQNSRLGSLQMRICELEAYADDKPRDDNDAQLQDVYPDPSELNTKMSAFVRASESLCRTRKQKNDMKKRYIEDELNLQFPNDFDSLSEKVREAKLNKTLEVFSA